jgi:hypothetical protein
VEKIDDVGEVRDIDTLRAQGVLSAWMTCALRWYCKGASGVLSSASQPAGDERPPHRRRKLARCWTRSLLRLFLIVPLALATQFRCVCPECSSGNPAAISQQRPACGLHSSNRGSLALAQSASPSWLLTMLSCAVARLSVHHDRPSTLTPTSCAVFSSVERAAKVEP